MYNLEGVEAVIAAAEEENSPAILQVSVLTIKEFHMRNISYKRKRIIFCSEFLKICPT